MSSIHIYVYADNLQAIEP